MENNGIEVFFHKKIELRILSERREIFVYKKNKKNFSENLEN